MLEGRPAKIYPFKNGQKWPDKKFCGDKKSEVRWHSFYNTEEMEISHQKKEIYEFGVRNMNVRVTLRPM